MKIKRTLSIQCICFILWGLFCLQSCYDDKGNYDYMDIDEVKVSGLEESYTVRVGEPITIRPVIELTQPGEETDYSYEWVWLNSYYQGKRQNEKVWSTLKEWDGFNLGLPSDSYTFYYRVKDNRTGVVWLSQNFNIIVENDISAGFFILSEVNNVGRLDFISLYRDTLKLKLDILTSIGTELPSLDKPLGVVCLSDYNSPYMGAYSEMGTNNSYMAAILTEGGAYRLHPAYLTYQDDYHLYNNILLSDLLPAGFYIKKVLHKQPVSSEALLLDNNNNLYLYNRAQRIMWTADVFTNKTSSKILNISPEVVVTSAYGAIMYDIDSKSFAKQTTSYSSTSAYYLLENETVFDGLLFRFNNTGKELVYLHCRYILPDVTGNVLYTVLKDADTQEYFLGSFTHSGIQQFYTKLNVPELSEAKEFAMTRNGNRENYANEFLYFRTDDKIYAYNMSDRSTRVVYTADSGYRISKMDFIKLGKWGDYLQVCTYDPGKPADSCGKMEVLKVASVYGTLSVAEHNGQKLEWTGFGKIIDADWKAR